jgi:hypothetical protein
MQLSILYTPSRSQVGQHNLQHAVHQMCNPAPRALLLSSSLEAGAKSIRPICTLHTGIIDSAFGFLLDLEFFYYGSRIPRITDLELLKLRISDTIKPLTCAYFSASGEA